MKLRDKSRGISIFGAAAVGVIALAAVLRFYGLRWGLPDSLHSYSYHPDEFLIMGSVWVVLQSHIPRFYNYPSLFIYLASLAVASGATYGMIGTPDGAFLAARIVAALMGVGAVAATYRAGKSLWGGAVGLTAALILCIAPLHVQHSHFATVDVPSTLFIAAALGLMAAVINRGSWRDYLLCGAAIGFAAGTKYNAGVVVFSLIAAHFLRKDAAGKLARSGKLIAALGCSAIAFIISTPGAVLKTSLFLNGISYELKHSAAGHGLVFAGTGNGFIYTFMSSLWYGLGPGLTVLFAAAVVYALWKRDKNALVVLAFVLPYYAMISLSHVRFARYALPLFPAAALLIGWMACDIRERLRGLRWAWTGLFAIIVASALLYTMALDRLFVLPSPQDTAARWIFDNVPKGSGLGSMDVPWFYSPSLLSNVGLGTLPQRRQALSLSPYNMVVFSDYRSSGWRKYGKLPGWVMLSDYEIADAARLHNNESITQDDMRLVKRIWSDTEFVKHNYTQKARFANRLEVFGISFGSTQGLPHDMRYPAPTIWIYERKK